MMHPDAAIAFINDQVGYGLFARRAIPRGTVTWVRDALDQDFTQSQLNGMNALCQEQLLHFAYVDRDGLFVLCHDLGRYVNHSCDPNCLSSGFDFEFAIRDIAQGEQICDDYGLMNLLEEMPCSCESARCRGRIGPHDIDRFADDWDALAGDAFPCIPRVEQPLWSLAVERNEVEAVLSGKAAVPSCRLHKLKNT